MNPTQGGDQTPSTPNPALVAALTTEHYTLQSARSATVLEANGRSQLFLAALTGAVVALALVAELGGLGRTFTVFALSLLPAVLALGLTTYVRLADLAVQDGLYARAIGRIRAFYFTIEPTAVSYWMLPAGDDPHAVMRQAGQHHSRWHHMSHAATAVAALTAVVAGVLYALVAHVGRTAEPPLLGGGATIVAIGVFALLMFDQGRRWRKVEAAHPTLFHDDGTLVAQPAVTSADRALRAVTVAIASSEGRIR
ncbi:hypothetical protein [Nocardioides bizhenqiangii]|uniref:Uncharacterized protein n=1 Tax=Nocardioides bizhenqiangii TaxID=3095076 RepID=A0ABZ0ZU16_9ACTN|nr:MULTISPECIES: hypothetical protein [unclassified Nocardioides]MDZ5623649.1 hypothetical protein [Nocardioides sp. HM23]WQQ27785.1 hypothetical protein SHK19_06010 [Nocardioides sp. HM61]